MKKPLRSLIALTLTVATITTQIPMTVSAAGGVHREFPLSEM